MRQLNLPLLVYIVDAPQDYFLRLAASLHRQYASRWLYNVVSNSVSRYSEPIANAAVTLLFTTIHTLEIPFSSSSAKKNAPKSIYWNT